jgi:hypothetical protein
MIKTKTARKLLIALMALSLVVMLNLPNVQAAALTSQSVNLTNSTPGAASDTFTFGFTTASNAVLTEIDLTFSTSASGGGVPAGLDTQGGPAAFTPAHIFSVDGSNWTMTDPTTTGNGNLIFTNTGSTFTSPTAGSITVSNIANPSAGSCGGVYPTPTIGTQTETGGTCYVQITTKSASGTVDTGAATFTVQQAVSTTATVDPSITFSVSGVNSSTLTGRGATTTVSSDYKDLPFGHLTAGGATSIAAQSLTVSTNANGGFAVTMAMTSQMSGSGTPANKISPFITGGTPSTWSTPATWVSPSGSNKIGTGTLDTNEASAIGAATTDTNVTGWSGASNIWGPVPMSQSSAVNVMQSSSSINADTQKVAYQIGVDAYQPADIYSGTVQYFAIPAY